MRPIPFATAFLITLNLLACSKPDPWKTTVPESQVTSPDQIRQNILASYNEENDHIWFTVQFRKGVDYGESIQLTGTQSVVLDSQPMQFNHASNVDGSTTGSYYFQQVDHSVNLYRNFEISWTSISGRRFVNKLNIPSRFTLSSDVSEIDRRSKTLTVSYSGGILLPDEKIILDVQGDYGHYLASETFGANSRILTFNLSRYVQPDKTESSTIFIQAKKIREGVLTDSSQAGGEVTTVYQALPLKILVR